MRFAILVIFAALAFQIGCGAANPNCNGNGPSTNCSGNGQGRQSGSPPPAQLPTHVDNWSYVGQYLAGELGTLDYPFIRANLTYAEDGQVGNGAGRPFALCDNASTFCVKYTDTMRADVNSAGGTGTAMLLATIYTECGTTTAWFLHDSRLGLCSLATQVKPTGPTSVVNFNNLVMAAWIGKCFTGQAPLDINGHSPATCNGVAPTPGPSLTDPLAGTTLDGGFMIESDTSTTDLPALMATPTPSDEIATSAALQTAQTAWFPVAYRHANGSVYNVMVNGVARGINKPGSLPTLGEGSCQYAFSNQEQVNCLNLMGLPNVYMGQSEFFCQNQVSPSNRIYKGEFCPWYVNSSASIIASGKKVDDAIEFENGTYVQGAPTIGTDPNTMLAYEALYLLTYNSANPHAEVSELDVDSHDQSCSGNPCGGGSNPSSFLSVWPVQQLVPTGAMAIPVTAYLDPTPYATPAAGPYATYDGCLGVGSAGGRDSGGIISYLVGGSNMPDPAVSCGTSDDGSSSIGVYANASASCAVNGTPIGPCAWFVNLTNANYTIPCGAITDLGNDLSLVWNSLTFKHWVGIGQVPNPLGVNAVSGVFGDLTPAGGPGTITISDTANATFACSSATTGVMVKHAAIGGNPVGSGAILVP